MIIENSNHSMKFIHQKTNGRSSSKEQQDQELTCEKSTGKSENELLRTNIKTSTGGKSPLPKPDFSSLEKKEKTLEYKQRGSYKKPKSNIPESPMKSPNQKYFTPVKMMGKNLFGTAPESALTMPSLGSQPTCRKLCFGNSETKDEKDKCENFLEKLEEDEEEYLAKGNFRSYMNVEKDIEMKNSSVGGTLGNYFLAGSFQAGIPSIMSNDEPDPVNSKFENDYEILKTIATGEFGIVYKCISYKDKNIYAVKKSKRSSTKNEFSHTKSIAADLNNNVSSIFSPFCVKYIDFWMEEDTLEIVENATHFTEKHLHIVQEFCQYGDLLDYLSKLEQKNFAFTTEFYWDLIFEMMCGVYYLHECGYVHLDIKSGNFLIDENGCVKLGDFGLSRKIKDLWNYSSKNSDDLFEGDAVYLAPEIFHRSQLQKVDCKCDVFSLGLSILEILSKVELPQNGPLWRQIRNEGFEFPLEFLNNWNISSNKEEFVSLINVTLTVNAAMRPDILSLFTNKNFPELNTRYVNLVNATYQRGFNPTKLLPNDSIDICIEALFASGEYDKYFPKGKRSNSYKRMDCLFNEH